MKTMFGMFAKAVWWGTVSGAAPYTLLLILPLALSMAADGDPFAVLLILGYPLAISGAIVLVASCVIGLPLTAILSHNRRERQRDYAVAGLAAGAAIPTLFILAVDGPRIEPMLFFTIPGMIAGTVTGLVWGKWREALADEAASAEP